MIYETVLQASKAERHLNWNRIVGGTEATPGEFPYQISFQKIGFDKSWHYCGGSIYNEYWIITAGHCVEGLHFDSPELVQVCLNNLNEFLILLYFNCINKFIKRH